MCGALRHADLAERGGNWYTPRMQTKPLFIVVSAPSGCGKSTLCDMLLEHYHNLSYSVSCTTREPRGMEEDGVDYHFHTVERFKELVAEGAFLEYAEVHGNYYGTLKAPIEEDLSSGLSVVLDIDVQGAAKIREHVKTLPAGDPLREGFMDIFIMPPSMEELRRRLEGRSTDAPEVIERRLENAEGEIARADEFMFKVVNDDLSIAFKRICDLVDVKSGHM